MREKLLRENFLKKADIRKEDIKSYTHVALVNAMIGFKIIKSPTII
jgi:4-amino-4-deoxychorismate lyase